MEKPDEERTKLEFYTKNNHIVILLMNGNGTTLNEARKSDE